jgi:hypothetical protein
MRTASALPHVGLQGILYACTTKCVLNQPLPRNFYLLCFHYFSASKSISWDNVLSVRRIVQQLSLPVLSACCPTLCLVSGAVAHNHKAHTIDRPFMCRTFATTTRRQCTERWLHGRLVSKISLANLNRKPFKGQHTCRHAPFGQ